MRKLRQAFGDESRDADRPSIVFHITEIRRSKRTFKKNMTVLFKRKSFLTESVLLKAFAALVLGRIFCMSELLFAMIPRFLQSHLFHFVAESLLEHEEHWVQQWGCSLWRSAG